MANDRWEWNGPEEGDEVDLSIIVMCEGEEILQLEGDEDDLEERKLMAADMCRMLNSVIWRPVQ